MEKMKCVCCGREVEGNVCSYCGFRKIVFLDFEAEEKRKKEAEEYKIELCKKVSSFYIKPFTYEFDYEKGKLNQKNADTAVKISSGEKCFNKIIWTDNSFMKNTDESEKTRKLTVFYDIDGETKQFETKIDIVNTDNLWALGIEIDDSLSVTMYLGTKEKYTKSKKNDIEWK